VNHLSDHFLKKCEQQKIITCKDLLSKPLLELIQLLDIPIQPLEEALQVVSDAVAPPSITVYDKLTHHLSSSHYLSTTLAPLDHLLRGGIPSGSVTEIVGPPGAGKTQLCLMLSVLAGGGVVYLDTESSFSPERLVEIAENLHPDIYSRETNTENLKDLTQRVIVYNNFTSTQDVLDRLSTVQEVIVETQAKLLIVDSVASVARKDVDVVQRQELLAKQASILKYLSETFTIPIVVTNQVTTQFGQSVASFDFQSDKSQGSRTTAALGTLWAHCVNTRLVLDFSHQHRRDNTSELRKITIAKSPTAPVASFYYHIRAGGLVLDDELNRNQESGSKTPNFWGQSINTR